MKDHIDGLMLIVKKLGQLIDQKDERIKELSRKLQASSSKRHQKDTIKKQNKQMKDKTLIEEI